MADVSPNQEILLKEAGQRPEAKARRRGFGIVDLLEDVGRGVIDFGRDFVAGVAFLGELIAAMGRVLARPLRFRSAAFVKQLEMIGFRSVPIIVLMSFLVGCIIAQQSVFQLRNFGTTAFVADLMGVLVLRELGVLLTSIMIAGRSGSAITAEIGSMKMREEIDALRTMGRDPMEVLIVPRVLALVVALPILTFIASMSALFGGGLVAWFYGDVSPDVYLSRLQNIIPHEHVHGGDDQGTGHGAGHRPDRRHGGVEGARIRRVARSADKPRRWSRRSSWSFSWTACSPCSLRRSATEMGASPSSQPETVIEVRDLAVGFGDRLVKRRAFARCLPRRNPRRRGRFGTGKSVLMRTIVGLLPKQRGTIRVFGRDMDELSIRERQSIERRWGILFQQGALFSSLTVKQNIQFPIRVYLDVSEALLDDIAMMKIEMVGLKPDAADKFPSELSGGMIKRAALARALALDPEIVFLDEPTSGLDPHRRGRFR